MAIESGTDITATVSMEISLASDDSKHGMFRVGDHDTPGIYQRPLVVATKHNFYDPDLIEWYKGENNEPIYLMRLISDNPTLMGLLLTKCTILHGQGLKLMEWQDGKLMPVPEPDWPEEIRDFFDYNQLDWLSYQGFIDHEFVGNFFWQLRFSAGSSLTKKKIKRVDRFYPETVRAYKPADQRAAIQEYAVAPTWDNYEPDSLLKIKAFDRRSFFNADTMKLEPHSGNHTQLIYHGKRHLPMYPAYAPPHWYGARIHIELQNEIPRWHINNIINQFGARVKVSVSTRYIQKKLTEINPETTKHYTMDEVKGSIAAMVRDYLTNPENVGKVMMSSHEWDHQGKPLHDIIVETIKLDIKDDAYTALEETINNKITSSVGVQAALASLVTDKGMSSGSELTQAWNIEAAKARSTQKLILDVINFIHRYNGWDSKYTWAFPNPSLVTQDIAKGGMIPAPSTPQPDSNAV